MTARWLSAWWRTSLLNTPSCDAAIMVYHDPVIDVQAAASALSRHGHNKARAKIRAKCDEMAAELGWPLPDWSKL